MVQTLRKWSSGFGPMPRLWCAGITTMRPALGTIHGVRRLSRDGKGHRRVHQQHFVRSAEAISAGAAVISHSESRWNELLPLSRCAFRSAVRLLPARVPTLADRSGSDFG